LIFNKHVTDVHAVMQTDNIKHRKISDETNTTRLKTKLVVLNVRGKHKKTVKTSCFIKDKTV